MSLTFSAALSEITGFAFSCVHGMTTHRFDTYDEARTALQSEYDAHGYTGGLAECGDDFCTSGLMSIQAIESDPSPSMRVAETNAMHLLSLLGLPSEYDEYGSLAGSTTAEDFLGRVLLAQAVNPADAGVPATEERGQGGATMIHMGRRPGYSDDRLTELREVADFAVACGRDVQWC